MLQRLFPIAETPPSAKPRPTEALPAEALSVAGAADPEIRHGVVELINHAQAALERDPDQARRYLDRLAALLDDRAAPQIASDALLPKSLLDPGRVPVPKGGLAQWQIRRVIHYIDHHLAAGITADNLAAVAQLSRSHFCRAFRVSLGESPHAFVVRQRIRRAQYLMLATSDRLGEIACACGFADQAHLTRQFHRLVGETPSLWRRRWQNG